MDDRPRDSRLKGHLETGDACVVLYDGEADGYPEVLRQAILRENDFNSIYFGVVTLS